jgi:CubicO group peptidase (beta-lactamase class C family)
VIVSDGRIVAQWGDVEGKYLTHSCRKSFLSALYGRYVADGTIALDMTLAELGIDDSPPLSDQEKQATVRDCLKARSGVFHTALAESDGMHALKPPRDSLAPGTFWLYNNWDFIYQALKDDIADPIGMEHYAPADGFPIEGDRSTHYAYMFSISALDMARFGLLMLRGGSWNGRRIVPAAWIEESTDYYSDAAIYHSDGYGYMWWVAHDNNRYPHFPNVTVPEGTYSARGAGGHYLVIFPACDLVVVHRVNTWEGQNVTPADFGTFLAMVLDARLDH